MFHKQLKNQIINHCFRQTVHKYLKKQNIVANIFIINFIYKRAIDQLSIYKKSKHFKNLFMKIFFFTLI